MRTFKFFLYIFAYAIYKLPTLKRLNKSNNSEREKIVHSIVNHWSNTLVKITGANVKIIGKENIPDGAVLFVANHQGNCDIPTLLAFIDRLIGFVAKEEIKKLPVIPTWMEAMHCVFINRKNKEKSLQTINMGVEILKEGHSLVIFPEGTRSKGGPIKQFKAGSFKLAIEASVPIVPIAIEGTYKIMEQNGGFMKPANVTITILKPIMPSEFIDVDTKDLANSVREKIVEVVENNHAV